MMTKIDAYKAVVNGEITEDVIEVFTHLIEKDAESKERARVKRAEKAVEKAEAEEPMYNAIREMLGEEAITASMVAEALEIKVQKASSMLKQLVKQGEAEQLDVKIPKKGMQKGYVKVA